MTLPGLSLQEAQNMARVADFAFFGEWNRDGGTPEKMIIVKKTELLAQEQDPRYMPQMQEINNPWEETRKKLKLDEQKALETVNYNLEALRLFLGSNNYDSLLRTGHRLPTPPPQAMEVDAAVAPPLIEEPVEDAFTIPEAQARARAEQLIAEFKSSRSLETAPVPPRPAQTPRSSMNMPNARQHSHQQSSLGTASVANLLDQTPRSAVAGKIGNPRYLPQQLGTTTPARQLEMMSRAVPTPQQRSGNLQSATPAQQGAQTLSSINPGSTPGLRASANPSPGLAASPNDRGQWDRAATTMPTGFQPLPVGTVPPTYPGFTPPQPRTQGTAWMKKPLGSQSQARQSPIPPQAWTPQQRSHTVQPSMMPQPRKDQHRVSPEENKTIASILHDQREALHATRSTPTPPQRPLPSQPKKTTSTLLQQKRPLQPDTREGESVKQYPVNAGPQEIQEMVKDMKSLPRKHQTGFPMRTELKAKRFREHFYADGRLRPSSSLHRYRDNRELLSEAWWIFIIGPPQAAKKSKVEKTEDAKENMEHVNFGDIMQF